MKIEHRRLLIASKCWGKLASKCRQLGLKIMLIDSMQAPSPDFPFVTAVVLSLANQRRSAGLNGVLVMTNRIVFMDFFPMDFKFHAVREMSFLKQTHI